MSGFCGWIGTNEGGVPAEQQLARMAEGLPQYGTCTDHRQVAEPCGLALRSSPKTAFWSADSGLLVALQGYPQWSDPRLAREAKSAGHAAAAALAYRQFGKDLLRHLHGACALAVLDPGRHFALVANDRLGIEPLCYAYAEGQPLVFGATTDAVRAHHAVAAELSLQAVFDFLYFVDRIPAPHTIYRDVRKLLPGQCLIYDQGRISAETYWTMPYEADARGRLEELSEELMTRLRAATATSLAGEKPEEVGIFLSGGLDSSTVLGMAAGLLPSQAKAFTIGFDVEGFDETAYAALAARHFGARHEVISLNSQHIAERLPEIVGIYDEPFGNSSAVPAYFCAAAAKQVGIEVMLAGDGGDELFAGNARYAKDRIFDHYGHIPKPLRRGLLEPLLSALPLAERWSLWRKAQRYVHLANLSVCERLHESTLFDQMLGEELFAPDFLAAVDQRAPLRQAEEIFFAAASTAKLHRMLYLDLHLVLADSDLRKVGRMCELAGVRVRYPFLEEELAAFSGRIPPGLLLKDGNLRYFYKQAMVGFLPDQILAKEKHGFGLPLLSLVMAPGSVRDVVHDALSTLRERGIFLRAFIDGLLDSLHAGNTTATSGSVWDLMVLELWLRSRSIR